jgi:hypothetical protein
MNSVAIFSLGFRDFGEKKLPMLRLRHTEVEEGTERTLGMVKGGFFFGEYT